MKNLTSENTVTKRHALSISMSLCWSGAEGKRQKTSTDEQLCQADCEAVGPSNYEFSVLIDDLHLFSGQCHRWWDVETERNIAVVLCD